MANKLFLLDGMALVYRAHFAFAQRPILTSKGLNTSALFGFTLTLLDILQKQQPTHIGVAFDTAAPTARHIEFPEYKAQRESMPEELSAALPHVRRLIEAFNIPVIIHDGFEADDIIGTLVRRAEKEGFESYMVTPDKDFGQLVSDRTFIFRPSRSGDGVEVLGRPEILLKWGISRPEQVIDVLALWGDASDNIPGVPGFGEKTASKLIAQYETVEKLLAHTAELKGKQKENLETYREQALLSKRLATINCDAPCTVTFDELKVQPPHDEKLRALVAEFEFNSLGKRLFGDDFKAGRGFGAPPPAKPAELVAETDAGEAPEFGFETPESTAAPIPPAGVALKTLADVPHSYTIAADAGARAALIQTLSALNSFAFCVESSHADAKLARILGLAFSWSAHAGCFVPFPADDAEPVAVLAEFRGLFENESFEKVGHNLKFDLGILKWRGVTVRGKLFDTLVAHSLIEPDMRHNLGYLAEAHLGYAPARASREPGVEGDPSTVGDTTRELRAEHTVETADLAWQLRTLLEPLLKEKGQERVFYEIEEPLIPVLVDMEFEGVRLEPLAMAEFAIQLAKEIVEHEGTVYQLAGSKFNLNSPKQLGEILFDVLKIGEKPKKTKTGQYATNEQTLMELAPQHEIVRRLLDYRTAAKLKSTYADTLPGTIWVGTKRIHTTYNQVATSTGRLNSQNPNLQNIPIRTERGREIRKAFVPRDEEHVLLSADYSQIELRIIAALSHEAGMLEAFRQNEDIHTATAAKVFDVMPGLVTSEMRRKAKMVNFGIAYGISAFGLSQRLGIPRKEAAMIIEQYFAQYPGIAQYMRDTIEFARNHGYVETVTGRRRYLRDIRSANATVRSAAERNAINAPIQGTAADMIKLAMINVHRALSDQNLRTRMLLQVHDELVFDVPRAEEEIVRPIIEEKMKTAIPLEVPIVVEIGSGANWLEAH